MKILVMMDSDGHFNAAHAGDRPSVLNLIKNISDGDMYADFVNNSDTQIKEDLSEYCCQEWDEIVSEFIQRGMLEYVELPDTITKECSCQ